MISLKSCYHLHVYYLVIAIFQILLLSHSHRMHETVFHRCSPNWPIASPTCILIYLLNLPFMFYMQYLSLLLSLSFSMHLISLLSSSCPLASRANLGPIFALHQGYFAQSREGRLTSLSIFAHSSQKLISWTELCIYRSHWLLSPEICANLSLGQ